MKRFFMILMTIILLQPINVYATSYGSNTVKFSKCVDGDTAKFILNGEEITVRFLAIDTPETKHPTKGIEPYGKEASNYTCEKLKEAKSIRLEYDKGGKTDKYGRYLAWVFIDNNLLQEELIKNGLAKVAYLYSKYIYTEKIQETEKIAKENKIGIWSNDASQSEVAEGNNNKSGNKEIDNNIEKVMEYIGIIIFIIIILYKFYITLKNNKKTKK